MNTFGVGAGKPFAALPSRRRAVMLGLLAWSAVLLGLPGGSRLLREALASPREATAAISGRVLLAGASDHSGSTVAGTIDELSATGLSPGWIATAALAAAGIVVLRRRGTRRLAAVLLLGASAGALAAAQSVVTDPSGAYRFTPLSGQGSGRARTNCATAMRATRPKRTRSRCQWTAPRSWCCST